MKIKQIFAYQIAYFPFYNLLPQYNNDIFPKKKKRNKNNITKVMKLKVKRLEAIIEACQFT